MEKDKITGNSIKVRFNIPEAAKTADGVYVSMKIDAMNGNSMDAYLKINYADIGKNSSEGTKENTVSISQFGGYDIKTVVTYKDNKVTDLEVTGENFAGSFAVPNQRAYLPKAINKIKEQVIGLNIKDQTAFDKIDTVSGATTSATAIKNAVIESLGLKVKEEILAPATTTSTKPSASASTTKITAPSKVQKVKVKNIKKKSAKITFKKVKGANGYIIYRASKNMENIKQLQH